MGTIHWVKSSSVMALAAGLVLPAGAVVGGELSGIHATYINSIGTAVGVSWYADQTNHPRLRYGLAPDALEFEQAGVSVPAGTGVVNQIRLTGLLPGRVYYYQCAADEPAELSRMCSFRTAPAAGQALTFAVFGDIQVKGPDALWRRAAAWTAERAPDFCLALGDQVDKGLRPEQWQAFFADGAPLFEHAVFMPLIGNHDCYADRMEKELVPELYLRLFPLPENGMTDFEGQWYAFRAGVAAFTVLSAYPCRGREPCDVRTVPEQAQWLDRTLAGQADAAWRFVAFHPPVYSSGPHGSDTAWLAKLWGPAMEAWRVSVVLNGHTHAFEVVGPLEGGKPATNAKGTVYYNAAGITYSALAASNSFTVARQSRERQALVLLVAAAPDKVTLTTWDIETGRIHHELMRMPGSAESRPLSVSNR